jgi:hypothetical protein
LSVCANMPPNDIHHARASSHVACMAWLAS